MFHLDGLYHDYDYHDLYWSQRPSLSEERIMLVTSLLFVKARFYTHLLEPSKKMFAWEDRYIIHCSGASAMLTAHSACTCGVSIESDRTFLQATTFGTQQLRQDALKGE